MTKFKAGQKVVCITDEFRGRDNCPQLNEIVTINEYPSLFFTDAVSIEEYPHNGTRGTNMFYDKCFNDAGDQFADIILYGISEQIQEEQALIEYLLSTPRTNGKK